MISIVLILLCGFAGGRLAEKFHLPSLVGTILVGILLGKEVGNLVSSEVLEIADALRTGAVTVILMRAGLGLDRHKLQQQGSVALRLGFLPALAEMVAVAIASFWLFGFDVATGLLLGSVVAAESPAVIVPGMLRLKNIGYGVAKGIPDAILTGSALSDVTILLVFSLLANQFTSARANNSSWLLLPVQVFGQIILGAVLGYLVSKLVVWLILTQKIVRNRVHETLIVACMALLLAIASRYYPYSGYLSVMTLGFCLTDSPPLARRLREEFKNLWVVAEIVLFVLLGAAIEFSVMVQVILPGILLLAIGLLLGRSWGWYLSTLGSNWEWREKLFLLPGNSAKATVQAAIGAIPLSLGIEGGEIILAIAALSILVTAPLGAWAIPTFAPRLLAKDPVDPTKTAIATTTILVVVNSIATAKEILNVAGDRGRRSNGKVTVWFANSETNKEQFQQLVAKQLRDLETKLICDRKYNLVFDYIQAHEITEVVVHRSDLELFSDNTVFCQLNIPLTVSL